MRLRLFRPFKAPRQRFPFPKSGGQVVVELLLILPVFMLMVFFIMEIGHLAFQTIVIHHAAYEMARIGSLVAGPRTGDPSGTVNMAKALAAMEKVKCRLFKAYTCSRIRLRAERENTTWDPQAGFMNEDLLLTVRYPVHLIFPGTGLILSSSNKELGERKEISSNIRVLTVQVRMPIEKPYFE